MHPLALQLQELSEEVPVPLDEATDDDLLNVEESLLLPIPSSYRQFLLQTSDVVYGSIEPSIVADSTTHNFLPEITSLAWEQGLARDLMVVAEARAGFYVISQEGEVGFWQAGVFADESYEDIWDWVEKVWLG